MIRMATLVVAGMLTCSPVGLAQLPAASDEPITPVPPVEPVDAGRMLLGRDLFNDPRLSGDARRSCASCHDVHTNGATALGHDLAPDGKPIALNTNTVFNAALSFRLNWSGNARTLEDQAAMALLRPDFMAITRSQAVDRLQHDPVMVERFQAVYGHAPDWNALLDAIATFERTLVTPGSRFDLWLGGDHNALTPQERTGYALFKSIGCVSCHQGSNVGGNLFERQGAVDPTGVSSHDVFRVPSLRNVATTPPYFHDGSAVTLDIAVRKMASAQLGRSLSGTEVTSITAFLRTLTGQYDGHAVTAAQ